MGHWSFYVIFCIYFLSKTPMHQGSTSEISLIDKAHGEMCFKDHSLTHGESDSLEAQLLVFKVFFRGHCGLFLSLNQFQKFYWWASVLLTVSGPLLMPFLSRQLLPAPQCWLFFQSLYCRDPIWVDFCMWYSGYGLNFIFLLLDSNVSSTIFFLYRITLSSLFVFKQLYFIEI